MVLSCFIPWFEGFQPSKLVQDFFHPLYQAFRLNSICTITLGISTHMVLWLDKAEQNAQCCNSQDIAILSLHRFDIIWHYLTPHRQTHSISECFFLQQPLHAACAHAYKNDIHFYVSTGITAYMAYVNKCAWRSSGITLIYATLEPKLPKIASPFGAPAPISTLPFPVPIAPPFIPAG